MKRILINALAFQFAWWALILLQGWHWLWILPVFFTVHFLWVARGALPAQVELQWLLPLALVGILLDSALFFSGVLGPDRLMPAWLLALWLCFVTCVPYSLRWFVDNPRFGVPVFMVAGPLSYVAGMSLTPVEPKAGVLIWLAIAVPFWGAWVLVANLLKPSPGDTVHG